MKPKFNLLNEPHTMKPKINFLKGNIQSITNKYKPLEAQSSRAAEYADSISAERVDFPNKCPGGPVCRIH